MTAKPITPESAAEELKRLADYLRGAGRNDLLLRSLGASVIEKYRNRIINIHPSLIPLFCGDGFYGKKVHTAVLASGMKVTGATAHFVNEITDGGAIILQKAVPIEQGDTEDILQYRVMRQAEWEILPLAVSLFCEGRIRIVGNRTEIIGTSF